MNASIICGRLTRSPEVKEGSTKVARYTLAVDRAFKKEGSAEADFFNCVAFGKGAEFAEKYLTKGTKIIARGRMECEPYTDKDGKKQYPWQFIVESQEFAESKKASEGNGSSGVNTDAKGYVEIKDGIEEDLPFI